MPFKQTASDINFYLPTFGIWISYISLVIAVLTLSPNDWELSLLNFGWILIVGIISIWITVRLYQHIAKQNARNPIGFASNDEINDFMYKWISKEGQVVICTRDMTWGNEVKIKEKLIEKSRRNEVSIFLPVDIPLTNELKGFGAKIYTYQELDYNPIARFTIVHYGTSSAKVAVGRKLDDHKHYIDEFSYGNDPVYSVTQDLIEILKRYNRKIRET